LPVIGFAHCPAHDVRREVGDLKARMFVGAFEAQAGLEDATEVDDVLGDSLLPGSRPSARSFVAGDEWMRWVGGLPGLADDQLKSRIAAEERHHHRLQELLPGAQFAPQLAVANEVEALEVGGPGVGVVDEERAPECRVDGSMRKVAWTNSLWEIRVQGPRAWRERSSILRCRQPGRPAPDTR
jgi:hypothetical protein